MRKDVLRMERVTQIVDGVTTLQNLNLHIFSGEIVGLVCADTHGKQELIQLIQQNTPLHFGAVYFGEKLVNSYRHSPMSRNNVAIIDKHNRLVDDLTVADNIFVLRRGFKKYRIRPDILNRQLKQFIGDYAMDMDGYTPVSHLSAFNKCMAELLKAVIAGIKLVIVQDISNIVSAADLERFHGLLRHYAAQGMSFLYVCNHHEECFTICDRVALMENGRVLRFMDREHFDDALIWYYCLDFSRSKPPPQTGQPDAVLQLDSVSTGALNALSFSVSAGECVVLLDVNNNTFSDIVGLLTGNMRPQAGAVTIGGQTCKRGLRHQPVSIIQESPVKSMLFPDLSGFANLCFLAGEKNPLLWINPTLQKSILKEYEPLLGLCIHQQDVRLLSTVEQYNLIYYRIHLYNPKLVVCIQPFYGADMYLRHHVIHLIDVLRKKGIAVLMLAVNISDSLMLADRMLVVENGRLQSEYRSEDFASFERAAGFPRYPQKGARESGAIQP